MSDRSMTPSAPVQPARVVNPSAGDHVVTGDPVELAAAERAIHRSWAEFPYYARRFGARGRSFSSSDSGWLVTLCDLRPSAAAKQALWPGGVLASRGMPRWLLEHHLESLADELTRVRSPGEGARYEVLRHCATSLRERRLAHIDDATLRELAMAFDARVAPAELRRLRRMGGILVAAVADERDGIQLAASSVAGWTTDPDRFSASWITAVHETLAEARARAR